MRLHRTARALWAGAFTSALLLGLAHCHRNKAHPATHCDAFALEKISDQWPVGRGKMNCTGMSTSVPTSPAGGVVGPVWILHCRGIADDGDRYEWSPGVGGADQQGKYPTVATQCR